LTLFHENEAADDFETLISLR